MDLNFPVQTTPPGKKYKPLFAFLVTDLENKLNVNVHGNVRAGTFGNETSASHQGVGKNEVNLRKVLDPQNNDNEWRKLFFGATQSDGSFQAVRFGGV